MIEIENFGLVSEYGEDPIDLVNRLWRKQFAGDNIQNLNLSKNEFPQFRWINPCAYLGLKSVNNMGLHSNISDYSQWGVFCGTAFGGVQLTQVNLCDSLLQEGYQGITLAHTIHSGYQFIADAISNIYSIAGPNLTICDGNISSGIAFWQAYNDIAFEIIESAIVVGCEWIDHNLIGILKKRKSKISLCSAASSILLRRSSITNINDITNHVFVRSCSFICNKNKYSNDELNFLIVNEAKKSDLLLSNIDLIILSGSDFNQVNKDVIYLNDQAVNLIKIEDYYGDMLGATYMFGITIASILIKLQNNNYNNILIVGSEGNNRLLITILSSNVGGNDNE